MVSKAFTRVMRTHPVTQIEEPYVKVVTTRRTVKYIKLSVAQARKAEIQSMIDAEQE